MAAIRGVDAEDGDHTAWTATSVGPQARIGEAGAPGVTGE